MRYVAWNIRAGGGVRIPAIGAALAPLDADLLILTEYRDGPSTLPLHAELERLGYRHITRQLPPRGRNGVLIAARRRFADIGPVSASVAEPWRMIEARIGHKTIYGVYMPNLRVKIPYWQELIRTLSQRRDEAVLAVGDFNTCRPYLDEAGATDVTSHFMDEVQTVGFRDLWRDRNPDGREFSWYSHRGNGFRVDHAFASRRMETRIQDVRYDHGPRTAGVSDHSMLVLDLR